MRFLIAAIALGVLVTAGAGVYLWVQKDDVSDFCSKIPVGASTAQVRDAAAERGLDATMEQYTQMRIQSRGWHYSRPACRVFFNKELTVEYRVVQSG